MKRKTNNHRRLAAIMSIVLAIALILTGTYAWQSIGQQALNQSIGAATPAGGRLHNDMEVMGLNFGEHDWRRNSEANKDIYVENFENENRGRDIFVRVRLYEYMEIGDGAKLHPGDLNFATRTAESIILGADREDVSTWAPRIPGDDAISDLFRTYFEWSQGGQKYYMPTFNRDNMSLESDVKGDAVDPHTVPSDETISSTKRGEDFEYPADAGLHDFFELNPTHSALLKTFDTGANGGLGARIVGTSPVQHTAKQTLNADVVHISEWDEEIGDVWVLDDDGWAYWASPLAPQTATGLLLDSIKLIDEPELEWFYGIFVDAEMATASEAEIAFADLTPEAEVLLAVITADGPMVHSLMREVLTSSTVTSTTPFAGFPDLLRGDIERIEILDITIPGAPKTFDATEFITDMNADGGFNGKPIIEAQNWTHSNSVHPVVAFYTEGNTTGLYNLYIAGDGGVAMKGNMNSFFAFMDNLTGIDVTLLDTSRVTTMAALFYGATGLTSVDLSGLDTSMVTAMNGMFRSAIGLTSLDLSGFDTSSVTIMSNMFYGASGLTSLDLSSFDTASVTTMQGMFYGASGFTSLDLSGFNTSNVTNMRSMFHEASGLTSLDLSNFDTSNVTTMHQMFRNASGLTSLDLSNFDTSNVTTMYCMFYDASGLTSLNVSEFNTANVTDMNSMFRNLSGLTSLDLSNFDTSNVTTMYCMFYDASGLTSLNVSGFNTTNVTNMNSMFRNLRGLTSLELSNFDTSNVTTMYCMFYNARSLTSLDLSSFDTANVTNMHSIFGNTTALQSLDFRRATFDAVEINTNMFANSGINTITVGSTEAQDFILATDGWTRTPPRTILISPP